MNKHKEKVTVVIPCYNEAKGIANVIAGFDREELLHNGYELEIIVVDNNSTDNTAKVAKKAGARVITEKVKGKGNALRTGFRNVSEDSTYVAMLDGDDTYSPKELMRLLEPIRNDFCDVIIGSRLGGKMNAGAMTTFNRMGNWVFSHLVRYCYRANVTDVLTGYFAWKKPVIDNLSPRLESQGFAIEMEMITKMAKMSYDIYSVPISYHPRSGETNLRPIYDGYRILKMFIRNLFWKPGVYASDEQMESRRDSMKIVFVSDAIYPYNKGGKEKRMYELSTRLANLGHDVHIYTMHWWKTPEKERIENGVTLHAVSKKYDMYHGDRRSITEGIMFALACFKLFPVKFDVIDVDHMPFFPIITVWLMTSLTFRRHKFYGTWHEALSKQDWTAYMGKSGYVAALIERISIKLPYYITAASPQTSRQLASYHNRSKRVELVANGIDTKLMDSIEPTKAACDVLYIGRLVKDKNIDKLIRAMKLVVKNNPKVKCVIVGHGVEKEKLVSLVDKLNLKKNVSIKDPLPEASDVYAYMKRAKVFVLPSSREGFGIVALEALGCNTPVITVDEPANAAKDLVEDSVTGSVVKLDPKALAQAIEDWVAKEANTEIASKVSKYAWENIASKQSEVYAS